MNRRRGTTNFNAEINHALALSQRGVSDTYTFCTKVTRKRSRGVGLSGEPRGQVRLEERVENTMDTHLSGEPRGQVGSTQDAT